LILIIFGRTVAKKVRSQAAFYFPTSPNYCFCTTLKKKKPKIASFHLNAECCFANRHLENTFILSLHLVTAEPPFILTRIGRMHQRNLRRENSMLPSVTTHSSFTESVMMSVAVSKLGVVLTVR